MNRAVDKNANSMHQKKRFARVERCQVCELLASLLRSKAEMDRNGVSTPKWTFMFGGRWEK